MSSPLPPYRLWLWWCDGLTVFEGLLGAGWLVMHIVGVYELTEYYKERYIGCECSGTDHHSILNAPIISITPKPV
jgi:hypothetical protein